MYFLSQNVLPVTIYDSLDDAPFSIALPFSLPSPGTYQLQFYAIDTSENKEATNTVTLVLPGPGSLGFVSSTVPSQPIYNPGGALSVRPGTTPIRFQATPDPNAVNAQIDIFAGVVGWATISNAPSSPTAATSASLNIGGQNVDFYMYQLNGGSWSAEAPVSQPLALSGLPEGMNTISVLGRSQYGGYLPAANAAPARWIVSSSAPATVLTGVPASPATGVSAQVAVAGQSVANYQWTIDGSYYRPAASTNVPIVLSNLTAGPHMLAVIGEVAGVYQATNNPTTGGVDRRSAVRLRPQRTVKCSDHFLYEHRRGAGHFRLEWRRRRRRVGTARPYTVRITLADALGNTNFSVGLAQVGTLSGSNSVLANYNRGPDQPARPRTLGRLAGPERRQLGNLCAGCRRHQWHNPTVDPHLPQSGESAHRRALCCVAGSGGQWELGCLYQRHARRRRPAGPDRHPHSGRGQSCY